MRVSSHAFTLTLRWWWWDLAESGSESRCVLQSFVCRCSLLVFFLPSNPHTMQ